MWEEGLSELQQQEEQQLKDCGLLCQLLLARQGPAYGGECHGPRRNTAALCNGRLAPTGTALPSRGVFLRLRVACKASCDERCCACTALVTSGGQIGTHTRLSVSWAAVVSAVAVAGKGLDRTATAWRPAS
mmetsp:Transcript_27227/g.76774  ORF Transcript_27227/g.76774 Transcript_27227/m.76774 type:complete len:131 (+) Transcript_27227:481-873(+)